VPEDHPLLEVPFTLGSAAAMYSSISNMAAWMMLQLSGGVWNACRLLSEQSIRMMHAPHTFISTTEDQLAYCMGWKLFQAEPFPFLAHRGSTIGAECMTALIPQAGVGICVLTNLGGTMLPEVLVRTFFDAHFQNEGKDWSEELQVRFAGEEVGEDALMSPLEPEPALDKEAYAGTYEHPACGIISVEAEQGELNLRFGSSGAPLPLKHYNGHSFSLNAEEALDLDTMLQFHTGDSGTVSGVEVAQFKEQGVGMFLRKS
jgi:hypothetical protein